MQINTLIGKLLAVEKTHGPDVKVALDVKLFEEGWACDEYGQFIDIQKVKFEGEIPQLDDGGNPTGRKSKTLALSCAPN